MTDHLTSRAQCLIEEFEEGKSVREGIANVLLHLAVAWDNYSDGDEYWHGVTVDTLEEFATELTAPTLLDRALAGDKEAARRFLHEAGFTDEHGNLHPRYCSHD
jgi:predicted Zn-dependent peptidase